jgi:hypothetical protein
MSNLDVMIEEGRVIRKAWTGTDSLGRHTACLLAALVPVCGKKETSIVCPADVMPAWLAHLTPRMDDFGSIEAWPGMIRRYSDLANRWSVLTPATWSRLDYKARKIAVLHNRSDNSAVLDVVKLLDRAIDGDLPTYLEWAATAPTAPTTAAAAEAAWAAAWDSITDQILTAIEDEIKRA